MKSQIACVAAMAWLAAPLYAAQTVMPQQVQLDIASGSAFSFIPTYNVSDPQDGTETGLGLRIHFNSRALQFTGVNKRVAAGAQPVGEVAADSSDLDGDSSTDVYFVLPWLDIDAQWPGKDKLPLPLAEVAFVAKAGFTGATSIRTTAVATADNAPFHSTPMQVQVLPDAVAVQVRVLLQGAYLGSGRMHNKLQLAGLLPASQPYAAWGHQGTEVASETVRQATGADAPVDWVLVELRDPNNPAKKVASKAAILQTDGDVVDAASGAVGLTYQGVAAGAYHVAVRHRNHLGVMLAQPQSLSANALKVDFGAGDTAIYGKEVRVVQGVWYLLPSGDVNGDHKLIVDGPNTDKNGILGTVLTDPKNTAAHTNFQASGYYAADLNMDGKVLFAGPQNDVNPLVGNVLLAPGNPHAYTNFIMSGSLPR